MQNNYASLLTAALERFDVHADLTVDDEAIVLDTDLISEVNGVIAFIEGGTRAPFVRAVLSNPGAEGLKLRGDWALHLARALEDMADESDRRKALTR